MLGVEIESLLVLIIFALLALVGAWKELIAKRSPRTQKLIAIGVTVLIIANCVFAICIEQKESSRNVERDATIQGMAEELHESAVIIRQKDARIAELEQRANMIESIELRVQIDTETEVRQVTEGRTSVGLMSAVAFFSQEGTRYRFVTDYKLSVQQIEPTTKRLSLVYAPETPSQILGRQIEFLEQFSLFACNYSTFFKQVGFISDWTSPFLLHLQVVVNGIEVVSLPNTLVEPSVLEKGQAQMDVVSSFQGIGEKYRAKIARHNKQ